MSEPSESDTSELKLAEELIYDHIKEAPQQQIEYAAQLDDKVLRIFGAASIIIGLLGLSTNNAVGAKAFIFLMPLVPYILVALWTFQCINPDRFHQAMRADQLPKFWNKEENDVRRALLSEIGTAYSNNKSLLLDKAKYTRCALIATAIEVVLVVAALILYRLF